MKHHDQSFRLEIQTTGDHTTSDIKRVLDHYRRYHPRARYTNGGISVEWSKVRARLKEGYSADDLCRAIDGMHANPFYLGANSSGQKYLGLELCMRSSGHVARHIEYLETQGGPILSEKTATSVEAAKGWLDDGAWKNGGKGGTK